MGTGEGEAVEERNKDKGLIRPYVGRQAVGRDTGKEGCEGVWGYWYCLSLS